MMRLLKLIQQPFFIPNLLYCIINIVVICTSIMVKFMYRFIIWSTFLLTATASIFAEKPVFGDRVDKSAVSYNKLDEMSGIVKSRQYPDVFWVHNDDGDIKEIYAININGELIETIALDVKKSKDWEDIATAKSQKDGKYYIYVGDIGDNDAEYDTRKIYRIEEPQVNSGQSHKTEKIDEDDIDIIEFEYENGPRDCETLLADPLNNDLYLVSKRERNVSVYKLEYPQSYKKINEAKKVATLEVGDKGLMLDQIVGGDISPKGDEILIKSYRDVFYYKREAGESISEAFSKTAISINYLLEPQGEAICWDTDAEGYFTISEMGPFKVIPHLYYYPRLSTSVDEIYKQSLNLHVSQVKNGYYAEYTMPENGYASIYIIDLNGNVVRNIKEEFILSGAYTEQINIQNLPSGFYNYVIDSQQYKDSTKFLITK